ncbi:trehalose 6-phosphate phosphatase [Thermoflexales bacterium]|nr:trehalose 6-phosphate phosphatase [Thermoflexales bacterium]
MMINKAPRPSLDQVATARQIALFLDYDGTLAEFALTPDQIDPKPEVIALLTRLSHCPQLHVNVVSGRRLAHIQALLPVPNILLAGTYGLEMQLPDGRQFSRAELEAIQPALERLKPQWKQLLVDRAGFYLEDKVWALAIHARYAEENEAQFVLGKAHDIALDVISLDQFRWLTGHRFCEVSPLWANKGITVKNLISDYAAPDLLSIYVGDDGMDEEAFAIVKAQGGLTILVADRPRATQADYRLDSPAQVGHWLNQLAAQLEAAAQQT